MSMFFSGNIFYNLGMRCIQMFSQLGVQWLLFIWFGSVGGSKGNEDT